MHTIGESAGEMQVVGGDLGHSEAQENAHVSWRSAAIIHYTGNGLWALGLIPKDHNNRVEWLEGLDPKSLALILNDSRFSRCPTDDLIERLVVELGHLGDT